MKLCRDCKYSEEQYSIHVQIPIYVSPIDGCLQPVNTYCDNERYNAWLTSRIFGSCGKEGRYFEMKESQ